MNVALGLKARTGRAVLVAIGGTPGDPRFVERSVLPLLPAGAFAPYHAAERLEPAAARESVRLAIAAAHDLAASGLHAVMSRLGRAGHSVPVCGVLVGPGRPDWSTEEIIAVHVRMHQAEGELFRDVLVAGAHACKLGLTTLPAKTALDAAAQALGVAPADLARRLAALGRVARAPWGRDQKEAAAAALAALQTLG